MEQKKEKEIDELGSQLKKSNARFEELKIDMSKKLGGLKTQLEHSKQAIVETKAEASAKIKELRDRNIDLENCQKKTASEIDGLRQQLDDSKDAFGKLKHASSDEKIRLIEEYHAKIDKLYQHVQSSLDSKKERPKGWRLLTLRSRKRSDAGSTVEK